MDDHDDMINAVRASVEQLNKTEAPEPEIKAEVETPESAAERSRDEKGRFVASETEQPVKQATPEAPEAEPAPSTAQVKPPTSWSPEAKADFVKLPPAVQQAVLKREDEMNSGQQQYSDERRRLQELDGIIGPRRSYYQRFGFKSDAEAINHLFTLSDSMERDPAGTLRHLAQFYRVDLSLPGNPQGQTQQQTQPNISAEVAEQVAMQFARMTVQEFEQQPPEHYQAVKPLMKLLLENGEAQDLQDAYDKAIWMKPDIRTKMLESQKTEEEQKRLSAQTAKVDKKTKAANASLNGAPHGAAATPPKSPNRGPLNDVADDVRAAVASLS